MAFGVKFTGKELDKDLLPEGSYNCIISNIDDQENKAGNGRYLKLELQIAEGDHKNTKILDFINYEHVNPTAQSIGIKTLAKISQAIFGEIKEFNLDEINHTMVTIKTKNKPDQKGDIRPNIVDYKKYEMPF